MTDSPPQDGPPACRVVVRPGSEAWLGRLTQVRLGPDQRRFREQLSLPTDRAVIVSGHQPQLWHTGILAKRLALRAACEASGAHPAWLVVDQDEAAVDAVRLPVLDAAGKLSAVTWRWGRGEGDDRRVARARPAQRATMPALSAGQRVHPVVADRIAPIVTALNDAGASAGMVEQVTRATDALLAGLDAPMQRVYATSLARTELFAEFVGRMARDPSACVEAYNAAAAMYPHARLRAMEFGTERGHELPAWIIDEHGVRAPVYSRELASRDHERLAPRALMMTGLMRTGGCDVFIHGTGGAEYEKATDTWLESWLGATPPAASVLVTADVRLSGLAHDVMSVGEIDRAVWLAHHAWHSPEVLGDDAAARVKRGLARRIAAATDPTERAGLYAELHRALDGYRRGSALRLESLSGAARSASGERAAAAVAWARDWCFALHPHESLLELRSRLIECVHQPCGCP